jgi:hypothetical protein
MEREEEMQNQLQVDEAELASSALLFWEFCSCTVPEV